VFSDERRPRRDVSNATVKISNLETPSEVKFAVLKMRSVEPVGHSVLISYLIFGLFVEAG
jgi:hypothetical protein